MQARSTALRFQPTLQGHSSLTLPSFNDMSILRLRPALNHQSCPPVAKTGHKNATTDSTVLRLVKKLDESFTVPSRRPLKEEIHLSVSPFRTLVLSMHTRSLKYASIFLKAST